MIALILNNGDSSTCIKECNAEILLLHVGKSRKESCLVLTVCEVLNHKL